ncbi:MAG: hypothetical protein COU68_01065 [Candidatus Pacebacteria bacterium CG10_big_fil_rev_8_21_14_0_10_45_6]|nr:MAG: hypothetical protein COU68_01065 [Candidatus Pacebacteria bacterium CG10_big_fil_rev_8_21_14_0_10_45_6]
MTIKSHRLVDISILLLIVVLTALIALAVQQAFFKSSYIGFLSTGGSCFIPEGCGPTYKLYDLDKKSYIPLLGDLKTADSYAIIKVKGKKVALPEAEYRDMNYRGPRVAIQVSSYEVLDNATYLDLFW